MLGKDIIKKNKVIIFIIAFVFLLFEAKSNAQSQDKENDKFCNKIDSYLRYMPSRSVEAMSGSVEIAEVNSEYSYKLKVFDKLPLNFSLGTEYIGIEDTVSVELPAHLIALTADIETTLPFFNFDKTYLRLGISPSFYADTFDFPASAFRLPSRFMVVKIASDKWTFLAGIAVYPDFENEVLPILGFIYKPNHRLTFNIVPKRPNITYLINDKATLFAEGGGAFNSEFEVTRGTSKNVVLRYKKMYLGGGFRFKLNKFIQTSLSTGAVFNRSLKYRDNQGKVNIKDGLYTELRAEIKF